MRQVPYFAMTPQRMSSSIPSTGGLKTNNDELNKINTELESLISDEDFQAEYEAVLQYEDNATRILAELLSRRNRISSKPAEEGSGSATHAIATPSERTGAKLPKLTIAPFSGDVCKWIEFWEQFVQIVHNNATLTTTEMFHYLRQFLKGDAASVVAGLPTTEACYKDAVDMLQKRFGEKTCQEQEYFARLRQLTPVRASGDTRALRKLHDHVLVKIRGLESLGVQRSSFSSMFCDIILRTLPRDVVVLYHHTCAAQAERNQAADSSGPGGLLKLLSVEVESLEKSDYKDSSRRDSGGQHALNQPARSRN
uniref:Tick transposon n=1 Tax=Rhipicephalus zambeziensis TaxID=60191 RepID=A0A224Z9V1_9ACAR